MRTRKLIVLLVTVSALVLAACSSPGGGGTSNAQGGLDCPTIRVIVPYSPGGGSDQQVRRLQPALEDALGKRLNVTYMEGGDGAVGWNALADAEPDGCTISNVVAPNIVNLSMGGDVGFKAADFEYIAWTEFSPNIIAVSKNAPYDSIEAFIDEAKSAPGGMTIAGVGDNGRLLMSEINKATGMELSYVPVSGGVGDIIFKVFGGHIDSAVSGFSLLDGDQLKPLVLSAPSDAFPDVPTFGEAGYPGVKLVTTWGFILPPETPDEIVQTWNEAVQQALEDPEVKKKYEEGAGFTVLHQNVDEARKYFEEQRKATRDAAAAMK